MKLYYWNEHPNFGDELNPWLWSRLLPSGMLDDDPETVFAGIGTILNHATPPAKKVVVFGSGVGYASKPVTLLPTWKIYCLRGPVSARQLGLDTSVGICDPGILMRRFWQRSETRHKFSYMPHWTHMNESLAAVCRRLDMNLIDPTAGVEPVMAQLCATGTLVTECLHGAIVADALGVPWVPVSSERVLQSKWMDWTESLGIEYVPLPVSEIWDLRSKTLMGVLRNRVKRRIVASQLRRARAGRPLLSDRKQLDRLTVALESRLEDLKRDFSPRLVQA